MNTTRKTFFLTGSARGLGRSIAETILDAGHNLVATARRPQQLDDLVARHGARILPLALDVTDFDAASAAMKTGIQAFGRIDVVINNAGYGSIGSVEDMPVQAIADLMRTNFLGSVNVIKAALPALREQQAGRIIQVSSIGARIGVPGAAAYFASKWAISGFLESLAMEVAPLGIHVTAVEPAGMKTDFADDSSLTVHPSQTAYDATAGAVAAMMKAPNYGDDYAEPADIAAVILKVAALNYPPVRMLLSRSSWDLAKAAETARIAADDAWQALATSV